MPIGERHSIWNKLFEGKKKLFEKGGSNSSFPLHCHATPWFAKFDVIIF
jgi:hypothetical protein